MLSMFSIIFASRKDRLRFAMSIFMTNFCLCFFFIDDAEKDAGSKIDKSALGDC